MIPSERDLLWGVFKQLEALGSPGTALGAVGLASGPGPRPPAPKSLARLRSAPLLSRAEAAGITFAPMGFLRQFQGHAALVTRDDIGLRYVAYHGKGNAPGAGIVGKFYFQGNFCRDTAHPAPFACLRDRGWARFSPCQARQIATSSIGKGRPSARKCSFIGRLSLPALNRSGCPAASSKI